MLVPWEDVSTGSNRLKDNVSSPARKFPVQLVEGAACGGGVALLLC